MSNQDITPRYPLVSDSESNRCARCGGYAASQGTSHSTIEGLVATFRCLHCGAVYTRIRQKDGWRFQFWIRTPRGLVEVRSSYSSFGSAYPRVYTTRYETVEEIQSFFKEAQEHVQVESAILTVEGSDGVWYEVFLHGSPADNTALSSEDFRFARPSLY